MVDKVEDDYQSTFDGAIAGVEAMVKGKEQKSLEVRAVLDTTRELHLENQMDEIATDWIATDKKMTTYQQLKSQSIISTLGGELGALRNSMRDREWESNEYRGARATLKKDLLGPVKPEDRLRVLAEATKNLEY